MSNSNPLLSIIMPTYNDEKYLPIAIEAILSQSFADFELIIINDASPDNSDRIIRTYMEHDSRIHYLINKTNLGPIRAMNKALSTATGEYLYFASSDDKILPGFFEKMISLLLVHPHIPICVSDPGFFYGEMEEKSHILKLIPEVDRETVFDLDQTWKIFKSSYFNVHTNASILKTKEVEKRGYFSEEIGYSADFVLSSAIALSGGMIYVPQTLTLMRLLPKRQSRIAHHSRRDLFAEGDKYISFMKRDKVLWNQFYSSTLLARSVNSKYFTIFLRPRHWDILIPMSFSKLKLLLRKISRSVKQLFVMQNQRQNIHERRKPLHSSSVDESGRDM